MDNFYKMMIIFSLIALFFSICEAQNKMFNESYFPTWGSNHLLQLDEGRQVELLMDKSGGAGFGSNFSYGSGYFHMRIKIPSGDTSGVITAFYLISNTINHDEIDFEFLGNKEDKLVTLQTNVFVNGVGNREQRHKLWFDPSFDFHSYKILWNGRHIVFFVDDTPIREFKNYTSLGVPYPTKPMQVVVSLWNGDWATDGGLTKINWTMAPFKAYFQDFNIHGCPIIPPLDVCHNGRFFWNNETYWQLDPNQQKAYRDFKNKYTNYDYCTDRGRFPILPLECRI